MLKLKELTYEEACFEYDKYRKLVMELVMQDKKWADYYNKTQEELADTYFFVETDAFYQILAETIEEAIKIKGKIELMEEERQRFKEISDEKSEYPPEMKYHFGQMFKQYGGWLDSIRQTSNEYTICISILYFVLKSKIEQDTGWVRME